MTAYERLGPTDVQSGAFAQGDQTVPIVMINLLKFRARAAYPRDYEGASAEVTGEEAYRRFMFTAEARLRALGGRLLWAGASQMTLVGPSNDRWDEISALWYPNRRAYLLLGEDAAYVAALVHRTAALAETRAFVCKAE